MCENEKQLRWLVESTIKEELICKEYGDKFYWMDRLNDVVGIRIEEHSRDWVGTFVPASELDMSKFKVIVPVSTWVNLIK